jgi:hypothetical protein
MYLPWSNVVAVEQRVRRRGARLVVRVAPIALRARRLARPAAEIIEVAGQLRRPYEPATGVKGFTTRFIPSAS